MIVRADRASEKRCPSGRGGWIDAANRWGKYCRCIGPDCMAWEWLGEWESEPDPDALGYCGKSHRREERR